MVSLSIQYYLEGTYNLKLLGALQFRVGPYMRITD
jgi:hypothetical protein